MIATVYRAGTNGKMPDATRTAVAETTARLKEGDRVALTITHAPPFPDNLETIEKIGEIITWYGGILGDFNDVDTLLNYMRLLSCYQYDFGREVGMLHKQRNRCEFQRKKVFSEKMAEAMRRENGGKPTSAAAAKVEVEGMADFIEAQNAEQEAEAELQASRILLTHALDVLQAMRQHIANLREEKSAERHGRGSQHS